MIYSFISHTITQSDSRRASRTWPKPPARLGSSIRMTPHPQVWPICRLGKPSSCITHGGCFSLSVYHRNSRTHPQSGAAFARVGEQCRRMGFTLWNLLKASLLVSNSVAVLHRKRFLRKCKRRTPLIPCSCSCSKWSGSDSLLCT